MRNASNGGFGPASLRVAAGWFAVTLSAAGSAYAAPPLRLTDANFMEIDAKAISVRGRPGEEARLGGLKSYQSGRYRQAVAQFERAAGYADKYAQHYLSLMRWHGVGGDRDAVEAYIWSDLAAERGSRRLLAIREKMWSQLTPAQRAQAVETGRAFYARYGDAVAKPHAENEMRRFARGMTGSRVGFRDGLIRTGGTSINGSLVAEVGSNDSAFANSLAGSADELYGKDGGLAAVKEYWKTQDRLIETATVEVGEPKQMREKPPGGSRGR